MCQLPAFLQSSPEATGREKQAPAPRMVCHLGLTLCWRGAPHLGEWAGPGQVQEAGVPRMSGGHVPVRVSLQEQEKEQLCRGQIPGPPWFRRLRPILRKQG